VQETQNLFDYESSTKITRTHHLRGKYKKYNIATFVTN